MTAPQQSARRVRTVVVQVDAVPGQGLRVSAPRLGTWERLARNPDQLFRAVAEAFREAECKAYSDWRGEAYDRAVAHTPTAAHRRRLGGLRTDTYDPRAWARYEDGTWRSPGGFRYQADAQVVARVVARRIALGLAPMPSALPIPEEDQ